MSLLWWCYMSCIQMNWLSELFDRVGRDFNRSTSASESTRAAATGIVSLRDGAWGLRLPAALSARACAQGGGGAESERWARGLGDCLQGTTR